MFTLREIEAALDAGRLDLKGPNGKYYPVRRNGKTRQWKRDPSRWEIPAKIGFQGTFTINNVNAQRDGWLRIRLDA